jgi:hypothetical protein
MHLRCVFPIGAEISILNQWQLWVKKGNSTGLVTFRWLLGLNRGDGVVSAQPAIEINLGAACRTEGVKFLQGGLAADGAGAAWFKADRVGH